MNLLISFTCVTYIIFLLGEFPRITAAYIFTKDRDRYDFNPRILWTRPEPKDFDRSKMLQEYGVQILVMVPKHSMIKEAQNLFVQPQKNLFSKLSQYYKSVTIKIVSYCRTWTRPECRVYPYTPNDPLPVSIGPYTVYWDHTWHFLRKCAFDRWPMYKPNTKTQNTIIFMHEGIPGIDIYYRDAKRVEAIFTSPEILKQSFYDHGADPIFLVTSEHATRWLSFQQKLQKRCGFVLNMNVPSLADKLREAIDLQIIHRLHPIVNSINFYNHYLQWNDDSSYIAKREGYAAPIFFLFVMPLSIDHQLYNPIIEDLFWYKAYPTVISILEHRYNSGYIGFIQYHHADGGDECMATKEFIKLSNLQQNVEYPFELYTHKNAKGTANKYKGISKCWEKVKHPNMDSPNDPANLVVIMVDADEPFYTDSQNILCNLDDNKACWALDYLVEFLYYVSSYNGHVIHVIPKKSGGQASKLDVRKLRGKIQLFHKTYNKSLLELRKESLGYDLLQNVIEVTDKVILSSIDRDAKRGQLYDAILKMDFTPNVWSLNILITTGKRTAHGGMIRGLSQLIANDAIEFKSFFSQIFNSNNIYIGFVQHENIFKETSPNKCNVVRMLSNDFEFPQFFFLKYFHALTDSIIDDFYFKQQYVCGHDKSLWQSSVAPFSERVNIIVSLSEFDPELNFNHIGNVTWQTMFEELKDENVFPALITFDTVKQRILEKQKDFNGLEVLSHSEVFEDLIYDLAVVVYKILNSESNGIKNRQRVNNENQRSALKVPETQEPTADFDLHEPNIQPKKLKKPLAL